MEVSSNSSQHLRRWLEQGGWACEQHAPCCVGHPCPTAIPTRQPEPRANACDEVYCLPQRLGAKQRVNVWIEREAQVAIRRRRSPLDWVCRDLTFICPGCNTATARHTTWCLMCSYTTIQKSVRRELLVQHERGLRASMRYLLRMAHLILSLHSSAVIPHLCPLPLATATKFFWRLLAASSPRLSKYQLTWTCDLPGVDGHQKVSSKDKTNSVCCFVTRNVFQGKVFPRKMANVLKMFAANPIR